MFQSALRRYVKENELLKTITALPSALDEDVDAALLEVLEALDDLVQAPANDIGQFTSKLEAFVEHGDIPLHGAYLLTDARYLTG